MAGKRGRPKKVINEEPKKRSLKEIFQISTCPVDYVKSNPVIKNVFLGLLVFSVFSFLGLIGPFKLAQERFITVTGSYSSYEDNNTAIFIATVSTSNENKDTAVSETERASNSMIEAVTAFGVDPKDIKTTNNSVYETEKMELTPANRLSSAQAQKEWVASTSVEIKLKDIAKAGELTSLLNSLSSVQIYGPEYRIDEDAIDEGRMLSNAIDDAKEKAKFISKNHNKRLGTILSIEELGDTSAFPMGEVLGLGGADRQFMPGTTKIVKKVKVTFVLR